MPKYIYTAKSYTGETKGGEIVAKDEKDVAVQLRSEGFLPTSIRKMEEEGGQATVKFMDRFVSVPLKEKMVFAKNLSVMISSGLTVSRAVGNLREQTKNKSFQKVLGDVYEQLQEGKTLSEGLSKYPGVFNELFVNMVRVGETGGNLDEVLRIIALQLEKEHNLISKVRGAMIYPAVIVVVMLAIAVLMLTFVLPKLLGVFKEMDAKLPPTTQFVIGLSDLLRNHGLETLIVLIILGILGKIWLSKESGKRALSYVTLTVPIMSNIVIKVNCARFARIYSSLLRSGVSVVDALSIISNTLGNRYYRDALRQGMDDLQKGVNLSTILAAHPKVFPLLVTQIVQVGEETGKTETVLMQVAEFYEEEVNEITKNMSSIIEPVLMVMIGGGVGFFAISMLQPMYSLMDSIK